MPAGPFGKYLGHQDGGVRMRPVMEVTCSVHALFSFISQNWRAKPFVSHEVIINLIAATTTKTGLRIECGVYSNSNAKGIKVTGEEFKPVNRIQDSFHGQ